MYRKLPQLSIEKEYPDIKKVNREDACVVIEEKFRQLNNQDPNLFHLLNQYQYVYKKGDTRNNNHLVFDLIKNNNLIIKEYLKNLRANRI